MNRRDFAGLSLRPMLRKWWVFPLLVLFGCSFPTEPSGCIKYESGVTFSGKRAYAYQCWGDAVPADSLDHPEWW